MLVKIANLLRRARSERGFTLIELVVVIGIIGVLAGIAVPRYSAYKTTAENNADALMARVVQTAIELYQAEKGEYPLVGSDLLTADADNPAPMVPLYTALEKYLQGTPKFNNGTQTYDPETGRFTDTDTDN